MDLNFMIPWRCWWFYAKYIGCTLVYFRINIPIHDLTPNESGWSKGAIYSQFNGFVDLFIYLVA